MSTTLSMTTTTTASSPSQEVIEFMAKLHRAAASCCFISVFFSISVILMQILTDKNRCNLKKKQLVDRLVLYLAIGDLSFSILHGIDHIYVLQNTGGIAPDVCKYVAFMMHIGIEAQQLISGFVALAAFISVVIGRKLLFGKFDYTLLGFSFGVPLCFSIVGISTDILGFNGVWCGVRSDVIGQNILSTLYTGFCAWVSIVVSTITYVSIAIKVISSNARVSKMQDASGKAGGGGTQNMAQIVRFFMFIAILLWQWMPLSVYLLWGVVQPGGQPANLTLTTVIISNLGGFYNGFIYTFIRVVRQIKLSRTGPTTVATRTNA